MSTTPTGPPATPRSSGAPAAVAGSPQRYAVWLGWALTAASECLVSGDVPVGAVVLDAGGQPFSPTTVVDMTSFPQRMVAGESGCQSEARRLGSLEKLERALSPDLIVAWRLMALRDAARHTGSWRLSGCTLAVTLEPCPMCAGALMLARVERVVFGAWDPKLGACGSVWDLARDRAATHHVEVVGGVREGECAQLITDFFAGHRL